MPLTFSCRPCPLTAEPPELSLLWPSLPPSILSGLCFLGSPLTPCDQLWGPGLPLGHQSSARWPFAPPWREIARAHPAGGSSPNLISSPQVSTRRGSGPRASWVMPLDPTFPSASAADHPRPHLSPEPCWASSHGQWVVNVPKATSLPVPVNGPPPVSLKSQPSPPLAPLFPHVPLWTAHASTVSSCSELIRHPRSWLACHHSLCLVPS